MCADHQQRIRRGIVISDLHLFARRSRGAAGFDSLRSKLSSAEVLVLNGDIFDFRWSTLGKHNKTLPAAVSWLRNVAEDFPDCQIHFIVGNHDCRLRFSKS